MRGRILVVDDEQSMCELLADFLRSRHLEVCWYTSAQEALSTLLDGDFDAVLTDLKMAGLGGLQLCERVVSNRPGVPVVVMTAFGSLETAQAAIRAGAYDFVTKPVELELLDLTLARAFRHRELQEKVKFLTEEVERSSGFGELLGQSPPMHEMYALLDRIAASDASVLITGESGTGKELVARGLHRQGPRSTGPFVPLNCSAFPEQLLESQLFGHVRGAFTDAKTARKGLFLEADGGTLLLDEIGDLPLALQPKLLRALEERLVRPVGASDEEAFDARIVASTNQDLEVAVEEGRFREDLFYRLETIRVEVPPLRSRGSDILLLAQHFVKLFAGRSGRLVSGLTAPTAEKLLSYSWPGNVRELRNVVERAVALTRYEELVVEDFPPKVRDYRAAELFVGGSDPSELVGLDEVERRYVLHVLKTVSGNRTLAARLLGIDRKTLYRKLQGYVDG